MNQNHREQFMALLAVEGFTYEFDKLQGVERKSKKAAKRIFDRVMRMKDDLHKGEISDVRVARSIMLKYDKMKTVLKSKYPEEIDMLVYLNAILYVVATKAHDIPKKEIRDEWSTLEGMLFTLYVHFDPEVSDDDSIHEGSVLGRRLQRAMCA